MRRIANDPKHLHVLVCAADITKEEGQRLFRAMKRPSD
jgi:hypothetical protein